MPITAIRPSDLPFGSAGSAACAAARAADVVMKLPGVPGEFRVRFTGTGTAVMPVSTQNVFDVNNEQSSVEMVWYQNKFVGKHWLLGEFEVDLADDRPSVGSISVVGEPTFGPNTVNTNDFYFDFKFKRFPFLNMRNVTPIRNSAVIAAVPPVGSIYKLEGPADGRYLFKSGPKRLQDIDAAPGRTIEFRQCDVVVFPERNVDLSLVTQQREADGRYTVEVEIKNPTGQEATFAYFTVIHYAGVSIENDYGFALIRPGETTRIRYEVASSITGRSIDLPFFAALYEPASLQGSRSLNLDFEF